MAIEISKKTKAIVNANVYSVLTWNLLKKKRHKKSTQSSNKSPDAAVSHLLTIFIEI